MEARLGRLRRSTGFFWEGRLEAGVKGSRFEGKLGHFDPLRVIIPREIIGRRVTREKKKEFGKFKRNLNGDIGGYNIRVVVEREVSERYT